MTLAYDEIKAILDLSDEVAVKLQDYLSDGSLSIMEIIKLIVTECPALLSVGLHVKDLSQITSMEKAELEAALSKSLEVIAKIVELFVKK
jgi:hypothetical protein